MNGKGGITNMDRQRMEDAAEAHAGASYSYYDSHVHAQWGSVRNAPGGDSTSSQRSTKVSESEDDTGSTDTTDTKKTASLSPSSGSSVASAGSRYRVDLATPSAFRQVYWYVAGPGESGLGSLVSTTRGGGRSTSASFAYTLPSDASGDYVITAYVYNYGDASVYEVKHKVSVAAAKLLACGHAVGTPGYHDKIYCGFCRAPTYACLRDDGHGPVRCPKDSDGQTCTVDEGWQIACADPPHVCKYPSATQPQPVVTPPKETTQPKPQPKPEPPPVVSPPKETPPPQWVACGNSSCSEGGKVLSVNAHKVVCPNNPSHTYWSCNPGGVAYHTNLHTCTKCSQTYSGCTRSGCPRGGSHTQKAQIPTTPTTPPTNNNNGNSNNNNNDNVPKSPSKPDPPPVSYHACGVHPTTVSGDHSLQASCSRDSRCIATNFYYCQHTRHTYPAPPLPPDPPKPPKKCPAHRWTNCGGTVSHATTCGAGHTYYTCNPSAVSAHKWHVKAGVNCPAHAWTNCNGARSHATTCGQGHSYYTCNPEAVSAHSWHKPIVCPAHAWTNCKGAVSHAKKCGRGHTYYTCNPSAVSAHSWH